MTPEETRAALLADWLKSPPGTPAPEGLDEDVLAAVYALRPDRAPPLGLTIDTILDGVESGPFAPHPGLSGGSGRKDVSRRDPGPRRPRRVGSRAWWAIPGAGLVLTALAVTLIAVKVGGSLYLQSPEMARLSEAPSAPTSSTPTDDAGAPAAPMLDAPAPDAAPSATAAAPRPMEEINEAPPPAKAPSTIAEAGSSAGLSDAPADELAGPTTRERDAAPTTATVAPAAVPTAPPLDVAAASPAPAPELAKSSSSARGYSSADKMAGDDEDANLDRKEKRDEAPQRASAQRPSAEAAPAGSAVQAQTGGGSTPFDYNPSFYTAYPELSAAYAAALANESAGRYSEALATYAGFLVSPHTDVAQDAAWRAARCLRSLGRLDDALTTVQSGLRRSSSNTPYRTNLYNLQGELHSAQGKSGDAQKAWAEAARLNAGR